jgi:hypothetical protein
VLKLTARKHGIGLQPTSRRPGRREYLVKCRNNRRDDRFLTFEFPQANGKATINLKSDFPGD